jgi:hypothetical protein
VEKVKGYLKQNHMQLTLLSVLVLMVLVGLMTPETAVIAGAALTTTSGQLGNGTILRASSGSPTGYVVVNNARQIEFDNGSNAKVDMTNLTSDWKEFLLGLPDPGSLTFQVDTNFGDAGQALLRAARIARTKCDFQVILPAGTTPTATMQGYVSKFPVTIGGIDAPIQTHVECFMTGPITLS